MRNALIVDDHELVLEGLTLLLEKVMPPFTRIFKAQRSHQALEIMSQEIIHFVFLDIQLAEEDGRALFQKYKKMGFAPKTLMLSSLSQPFVIRECLGLGVDAYLLKSDQKDEIEHALSQIELGLQYVSSQASNELNQNGSSTKPTLTEREREILQMIADEKSSKEIAAELYLSLKTVENHRTHLMQKLEASNMAGLIKKGIHYGFIKF